MTRQWDGYHINIRASKTDPFCLRPRIKLSPSGDSSLCAIEALDLRMQASHTTLGALFKLNDGTVLTQQQLNRLIKALAVHCRVPPERYSPHSFGFGAASAAAAVGIPD